MSPSEIIVTKTDLSGKIRYANRTFYKFAGYTPEECIGVQHNIIRHPDMPRSVFKLFWDTIQKNNEIFAYVNNRSRNGDHYWVLAHVTPSHDANGKIIGYHSNRRAPNRNVLREHIEPLYADLNRIETEHAKPKEGLAAAEQHLRALLEERKMSFNELIFGLGV